MVLEKISAVEFFAADSACVGPVQGLTNVNILEAEVSVQMVSEVSLGREGFGAVFTLEWLLSRVNPFVGCKVSFVLKGSRATRGLAFVTILALNLQRILLETVLKTLDVSLICRKLFIY